MNYIFIEKLQNADLFDAYTKARFDVVKILEAKEFKPILIEYTNFNRKNTLERIKRHFSVYKLYKDQTKILKKGDNLLVQYPENNDCLFLGFILTKLKRKGINTIGLIHDLDLIRYGKDEYSKFGWIIKKYFEEKKIKNFTKLIALNDVMKDLIHKQYGISNKNMSSLVIWDYLIPEIKDKPKRQFDGTVCIAGNLVKKKAGYIYSLPKQPIFSLYGHGYVGKSEGNIIYNGALPPDDLPNLINGDFGLVWDGDSISTCSGLYGSYLSINNPHKTSLYLASYLPVIIWEGAALAKFIVDNNCGITVKSLDEIENKISMISPSEYEQMKNNAVKIGKLMHEGYYLLNAINELII